VSAIVAGMAVRLFVDPLGHSLNSESVWDGGGKAEDSGHQ
jgi:hypothetical protein